MSELYTYLTSAGIDATAASWGCVAVLVVVFVAAVSLLLRLCCPRKHK